MFENNKETLETPLDCSSPRSTKRRDTLSISVDILRVSISAVSRCTLDAARERSDEKNVIKHILWKVYIPPWVKTLAPKPIFRAITKFSLRSYIESVVKFASYHRKIIRVSWAHLDTVYLIACPFSSRSSFPTRRKNYSRTRYQA